MLFLYKTLNQLLLKNRSLLWLQCLKCYGITYSSGGEESLRLLCLFYFLFFWHQGGVKQALICSNAVKVTKPSLNSRAIYQALLRHKCKLDWLQISSIYALSQKKKQTQTYYLRKSKEANNSWAEPYKKTKNVLQFLPRKIDKHVYFQRKKKVIFLRNGEVKIFVVLQLNKIISILFCMLTFTSWLTPPASHMACISANAMIFLLT